MESDKRSHVLLIFINTNRFFLSLHIPDFFQTFFQQCEAFFRRAKIRFNDFGAYAAWNVILSTQIRQEKLFLSLKQPTTNESRTRTVLAPTAYFQQIQSHYKHIEHNFAKVNNTSCQCSIAQHSRYICAPQFVFNLSRNNFFCTAYCFLETFVKCKEDFNFIAKAALEHLLQCF